MTEPEPPQIEDEEGTSVTGRGHRNPQLDQFKRTWYFLRRNTLAVIGLGILLLLAGIGVYALSTPIPWDQLPQCQASNNQVVTFHEIGLPPGLTWSVTADNVTHSSTTTNVNFSMPNAPVHHYTVNPLGGYSSSPSGGTFSLGGATFMINITFTQTGFGAVIVTVAPSIAPAAGIAKSCTICTYSAGDPSPAPGCYVTPKYYPSIIPPTLSLSPLGAGPLPFGGMSTQPTNAYYYNLYNGLLRGADYSLFLSVAIVSVGAFAGLFIGVIAGFWGGIVDEVLMRLVDIFLSIPQILFVIIVVAVVTTTWSTQILGLSPLGTSVFLLVLAFMAVWWPFYARLVRGQVLVVREQKFVEAARACGASKRRIALKHIVPNSMYPIFIQMSLDVGTVPLLIGFLVFLGFRLWPYPYFPEWGTISAIATLNVVEFGLPACEVVTCSIPWWQLFFPGLALFLFSISVNFLSDGLRDALDPRLRR